jgi:hypothetical protein
MVNSVCVRGFLCYIKLKEMQNKYLSALRTKYASFGLSKEALDRVALQRVKTIANEDEIDADIANAETTLLVMKEMQRATDTLRTDNAKYQKELAEIKNDSTKPAPQTEQPNPYAETIAEMRAFMQSMKNEFAESQKKARTETILTQVHEKMKANGCTNDFIRNITLKGIEIGDTETADSIAEKYKSVYDQNCKEAFGEGFTPPRGGNYGKAEANDAYETKILQDRGLLPKSKN